MKSFLSAAGAAFVLCLSLPACGVEQVFGDGPADMTELPPQGQPDRMARGHRRGDGGYAEGGIPAQANTPDAPEEARREPGGFHMEGPGGQMGGMQGGGADITPQSATPDTEVSYGQNGQR